MREISPSAMTTEGEILHEQYFQPKRSPDRNQTELFEFIKAGEYEFLSPYWDNISSSK
jgi:hypothetical protein